MLKEVIEIVTNACHAYKAGEITLAQFCDVTRIPLKDLFLSEAK